MPEWFFFSSVNISNALMGKLKLSKFAEKHRRRGIEKKESKLVQFNVSISHSVWTNAVIDSHKPAVGIFITG